MQETTEPIAGTAPEARRREVLDPFGNEVQPALLPRADPASGVFDASITSPSAHPLRCESSIDGLRLLEPPGDRLR